MGGRGAISLRESGYYMYILSKERLITCKRCNKEAVVYSPKALYCGSKCRLKANYKYEKNKTSR